MGTGTMPVHGESTGEILKAILGSVPTPPIRFNRDPGLGLLLEGVDHVNRLSDRDRIDRAVGSASVMGRNLHHLAAKTMQWLRLNTQFALLRSVQRIADVVLDASRK